MKEPEDSIVHDAELNEKLDRMVFNARVSGAVQPGAGNSLSWETTP